jgi:DNA ligase-associated metallophosphoesterase
VLTIEWANQKIVLLHERAMWMPDHGALIVADLHLGKPASFRTAGVPVPDGPTAHDLERLAATIRDHSPERLIILGDFLHARAARSAETLTALRRWRDAHQTLHVTMVRGNHDLHAGDPPDELSFTIVDEPSHWMPSTSGRPLYLAHDPAVLRGTKAGELPPGAAVLCGHLHPGVSIRDPSGLAGLRASCFWFSESAAVLPAFGSFTGARTIRPARGDRVFAVAPAGHAGIIELKPGCW